MRSGDIFLGEEGCALSGAFAARTVMRREAPTATPLTGGAGSFPAKINLPERGVSIAGRALLAAARLFKMRDAANPSLAIELFIGRSIASGNWG